MTGERLARALTKKNQESARGAKRSDETHSTTNRYRYDGRRRGQPRKPDGTDQVSIGLDTSPQIDARRARASPGQPLSRFDRLASLAAGEDSKVAVRLRKGKQNGR